MATIRSTRNLLAWLPAITAIIAAIASLAAAIISWDAQRGTTDKDYVALAINVLSNKESSVPSRRWAVAVLNKLSPVAIPSELASGLITGKSVLPGDLDPNVVRNSIRACLSPLRSRGILNGTPQAPLPKGQTVGDIAAFAIGQSGQLVKSNIDKKAITDTIDICLQEPVRE